MKKGLGKGLDALIKPEVKSEFLTELDINKIEPTRDQPRVEFDETSLNELAESIREFGIIAPIVVNDEGDTYTIVAGERRYRAARIVGLDKVPVIIKKYGDLEKLQVSIIENIQREDLNPIEEARAYQRLNEVFFYTQDEIAKKVSKSRNTIGNQLSLLNLSILVQNFILDGSLKVMSARKLLKITDPALQLEIAREIIDNDLDLKEIDELIESYNKKPQDGNSKTNYKTIFHTNVEDRLREILGTKVSIKAGKDNKGSLIVEYYSEEELERIIQTISKHSS